MKKLTLPPLIKKKKSIRKSGSFLDLKSLSVCVDSMLYSNMVGHPLNQYNNEIISYLAEVPLVVECHCSIDDNAACLSDQLGSFLLEPSDLKAMAVIYNDN
ncbi:hypothetical protein RF11_00506 [Thelohanellus kitauei]|uniref:Uncharacterized protein n=1 Tax=Thelohanellus kitauei TaxID=669202 RepID=A0A0C2J5F5_THEKT|nr:hypothetical protein RF11_00506 [Thelohanellus kitauei]